MTLCKRSCVSPASRKRFLQKRLFRSRRGAVPQSGPKERGSGRAPTTERIPWGVIRFLGQTRPLLVRSEHASVSWLASAEDSSCWSNIIFMNLSSKEGMAPRGLKKSRFRIGRPHFSWELDASCCSCALLGLQTPNLRFWTFGFQRRTWNFKRWSANHQFESRIIQQSASKLSLTTSNFLVTLQL